MRKFWFLAAIAAMALLMSSAVSAGGAKKKKPAPKKRTTTSASKRRKSATTWRNRQMTPTPERYKEIQDALAAKGYLNASDVNGQWGASSVDALKQFQADQNLQSTGKINSLSLIALGLGPKHDSPPPKPPAPPPPPPEEGKQ